jgi:hypothetical protein
MTHWKRSLIPLVAIIVLASPIAGQEARDPDVESSCIMESYERAQLQASGQVWTEPVDSECDALLCAMETYQRARLQADGQSWVSPADATGTATCAVEMASTD